ncbi:LysR family transcriptional regulator [Faecalibacterium sp. 7]|uniref:LysR family transcriptional regulator n=1 Tax=Faecalibacterium sp. 7 TaxID=3402017 RepID=UPI003C2BA387
MNDHQLLCFLTVSRTLNFTTAARELYCTQPALSYQIRSLEKELDLALFERSTTRVALTEAGRAFVPQAEDLSQHPERPHRTEGLCPAAHADPAPAAGAAAAGPHLSHPDGTAARRAAGV